MITVITKQVRPNKDVPFYFSTVPETANAIGQLIATTTNIMEPPTVTLSEDDLEQTVIAKYADEDQLRNFLTEFAAIAPTFFPDRQTYSEDHGIQVTRDVVET